MTKLTLCHKALIKIKRFSTLLRFVQKKVKTEQLDDLESVDIIDCKEYIKDFNESYKDKTYEEALEAVKSFGINAFRWIPEEFLDYNLYLTAVKYKGEILEYVPLEFRDYKMCLAAVENFTQDTYETKQDIMTYVPISIRKKLNKILKKLK